MGRIRTKLVRIRAGFERSWCARAMRCTAFPPMETKGDKPVARKILFDEEARASQNGSVASEQTLRTP